MVQNIITIGQPSKPLLRKLFHSFQVPKQHTGTETVFLHQHVYFQSNELEQVKDYLNSKLVELNQLNSSSTAITSKLQQQFTETYYDTKNFDYIRENVYLRKKSISNAISEKRFPAFRSFNNTCNELVYYTESELDHLQFTQQYENVFPIVTFHVERCSFLFPHKKIHIDVVKSDREDFKYTVATMQYEFENESKLREFIEETNNEGACLETTSSSSLKQQFRVNNARSGIIKYLCFRGATDEDDTFADLCDELIAKKYMQPSAGIYFDYDAYYFNNTLPIPEHSIFNFLESSDEEEDS